MLLILFNLFDICASDLGALTLLGKTQFQIPQLCYTPLQSTMYSVAILGLNTSKKHLSTIFFEKSNYFQLRSRFFDILLVQLAAQISIVFINIFRFGKVYKLYGDSKIFFVCFSVASREVLGVVGGRAEIPCDLTAPFPSDEPHIILFYKDAFGTPIYRYQYRT